jgi:hypothetical protein
MWCEAAPEKQRIVEHTPYSAHGRVVGLPADGRRVGRGEETAERGRLRC